VDGGAGARKPWMVSAVPSLTRNMDSQDPAGEEMSITDRHIDLLSVLHELGEVRRQDVVGRCGHDREEEVGIGPGNLGGSPVLPLLR